MILEVAVIKDILPGKACDRERCDAKPCKAGAMHCGERCLQNRRKGVAVHKRFMRWTKAGIPL